MVRDEHPNIACTEMANDALNVEHRNGIHAREWFIQQHELWLGSQSPSDLYAASFASGQALADAVPDVPDVQLF